MQQTCTHCSSAFEVTDDDLQFYAKISPPVPPPTLCPDCRLQRRMAHRNERNLYHHKCDRTGKQIISMYAPDAPYQVYDQEVWWSDQYDPLAYGRPFDFSRTFFEQFRELDLAVPKNAIQNAKSENCAYTNYSAENKDCYLVVGALGCRDCYYSYRVFYQTDICDCYDLYKCERCYECLESTKLYNCCYVRNCHNCSDLFLCESCTGCQDCFGCANLQNKRFHIYNKPFSEKEYRSTVATLRRRLGEITPDITKLHNSVPHRFANVIQCEECSGDQLVECKNCHDAYTLKNSQDCSHVRQGEHNRDCHDCNFFDNCELQYNTANNEKNYGICCGSLIWYCKEVAYTMNSFHSNHLFGCTGMKKQAYCVFNKQYTKEEYEEIVPRIVGHMKDAGEWGLFFPIELSAFGYNESIAQDFFPLSKEDVKKKGWHWRDLEDKKENYMGPQVTVPVNIGDVTDDICTQILTCEVTGKLYKIIPQELSFYRKMDLPIPRRCPDQRHRDRMARMNPRKLWNRKCQKCKKDIQSTYAPDRPEIVYCESCYLTSLS